MSDEATPPLALNRDTWRHFVAAVRSLATSEVRRQAAWRFGSLIVLLILISGLNVVNSYVGRDFMTAIAQRDGPAFVQQTIRYLLVFAALTVGAVLFRFAEERLGLLWREWLTRRLMCNYLNRRAYYRLQTTGTLPNPDQRIADDVRAFTTQTLSLLLLVLNGTITAVAFSGVLWSISPFLFAVCVTYAIGGSLLAVVLGWPLVRLNYDQSDRDAEFRAELVRVRENADSLALLHREQRMETRLRRRLIALTENMKRLIGINRNLGFFTTGYNYFVQVLPIIIVAPSFMRGEIEFGVITQSAVAFSHLLGAFSLIVTQFQSISSYTAVLARLTALSDAIEDAAAQDSAIEVVEANDRIAYEGLTLRSGYDGHVLVKDLSVTIPRGTEVLIRGSDAATVALFRATAGIWDHSAGRIVRPALDRLLFLPERPYLVPGTLREVMVRAEHDDQPRDADILVALKQLDMPDMVERAGGLDAERDWDDLLSLDEQQRLVFGRLWLAAPIFAFLDRPGTTLSRDQVERLLRMLRERGITYVTIAGDDDRLELYDALLDLAPDGSWRWTPIDPATPHAPTAENQRSS